MMPVFELAVVTLGNWGEQVYVPTGWATSDAVDVLLDQHPQSELSFNWLCLN